MVAPTIFFEYHSGDEITQFAFVPRTARADGSALVPHIFSRTVTPRNPQRSFQKIRGEALKDIGYSDELSVQVSAVKNAKTLNPLMGPMTLALGDPRQKLYESPIVIFMSDAEIEEMAEDGNAPRTYRDRIDRTRTALGWIDTPKRAS